VGVIERLGQIHEVIESKITTVLPRLSVAVAAGDGDILHWALERLVFPNGRPDGTVADFVDRTLKGRCFLLRHICSFIL
jgi:hypothetical protein